MTAADTLIRRVDRSVKALIPPSLRVAKRALGAWQQGEPELHLLPRLVVAGAAALDVGANGGVYAWHMARFTGTVVAFEPNPAHAAFLARAFGPRVRVEAVALSDRDGEAVLRVPLARFEDGRATIEAGNDLGQAEAESVTVRCRRLDGYAFGRVGLIKIDVEGHELAVLQGARALLARDRPNLIIEAEERHRAGTLAAVCRFLAGLGYRGHYLKDGRLHPLGAADPAAPAGLGVYNFVFVPAD